MSAIVLFNSLVVSPFNNDERFKKEIEGVCQIFFSPSLKQQSIQPDKTHNATQTSIFLFCLDTKK